MSALQLPRIGYTLGDQAGIGPEIMQRALHELKSQTARFVCMGERIACTPGRPTEQSAQAAWQQLERAAEALRCGEIDAVVTAPICKESLQRIGFPYPGQTEFFADRLGAVRHAMCLTGQHLTVALCTTHVALRDVPKLLTVERIVEVAELLAEHLMCLGITRPRLALAGLNPHNGEGGAFGDEEARVISPAVEVLQSRLPHVCVCGPCVPDVVYRAAAGGEYDGVVAPYHDQALIALKLLDFDNAVNITLGLPRLRVSPDHGTAFAIAGKGIANSRSTEQAFLMALRYLASATAET